MNELTAAFNLLKKSLPDYEDRPQQLEMAAKVFLSLRDKKNLIVEAGTGVGKSFAYLIPAILSNEKTIVSTASIALQDQLVNKDLVFLQKALPHKFSFAILKGKNNYLCLKREREFSDMGEAYKKFREWASTTETGDKDELHFIPEFWSRVCGDSDDCNSALCPFYHECFYYSHYRNLYRKDILVVNHHLLIYDLISEFKLIPFHNQLIIDEAHQLENIISHVFGNILSHSRVIWLLYRLKGLKIAVDHIFDPIDRFFNTPLNPPLVRGEVKGGKTVCPIPKAVIEELKNLKALLGLENVIRRLNAYMDSVDDEIKDRLKTTINYVKSLDMTLKDFIEQADKDRVYYLTSSRGLIELKSSMVEAGKPFNDLTHGYESIIMTSATLAAAGDFSFIRERLGLSNFSGNNNGQALFEDMMVGSPFDYKKQSLLYIDKNLPAPDIENNETVWQEGLKIIERLVNASRGRALALFTSYKHLDFVSKKIKIDFPFKSQGDMPASKLIRWFKKTPNSVLLATATFWHGIDIKGEKLSMVIIAKMPFGTPGEPVYDERCRRLGERWFRDLALPSAILMLRQGVGRLIRSAEDYGAVAILDSRVVNSFYGRNIISSLPEINIVYTIEGVEKFFDSVPQPVLSAPLSPALAKERDSSDITSLGNSNDPSAIPQLIEFTKSVNGNERRLAASALGKLSRFKPDIYKAVDALEQLLSDEKPQVRQYAMKAFYKIGSVNLEKLSQIINNPEEKKYNISLAKYLMDKTKAQK